MKVVNELPKGVVQDLDFKRIFSDGEKVYARIWINGIPFGKFVINEFEDMTSAKKHIKSHLVSYYKSKYSKLPNVIDNELSMYDKK